MMARTIILLACFAACGLAHPTYADESIAGDIGRLLEEAVAAPTEALAEKKLVEAEEQYKAARRKLERMELDFLAADLERTRGRIHLVAWQRDATQVARRAEAARHLEQALTIYQRLATEADAQAAQMELRQNREALEKNTKYQEVNGYVSRAHYALAWVSYHLGLLADNPDRSTRFEQAVERFSRFTSGDYRNHPVLADCFLGQALCQYELGHDDQVIALLRPATPDNTPPVTFKRMTYLRLKAYLRMHRYRELHETADRYFADRPREQRLDEVELGMAVEWARGLAALAGDPKSNPYHARYRERLDQVAAMVQPYGESWQREIIQVSGGQAGNEGLRCLEVARKAFGEGRYADALTQAENGLNLLGQQQPAGDMLAADLRYLRAAAAWNLQQWLVAHRLADDFLRHHASDRRCETLLTHAFEAGVKALKAEPALSPETFLAFLDYAEKTFANHPMVSRFAWERANLFHEAGRYREAEEILGRIPADSPIYRRAQYGLAVIALRQADDLGKEVKNANDERSLVELLNRSAAAIRRYMLAATTELPADAYTEARSVVDIALRTATRYLEPAKPDMPAVQALINDSETLLKILREPNHAADQRLVLTLGIQWLDGRIESANKSLDNLLSRPGGRAAACPHLAVMADILERHYDRRIADGNETGARQLVEPLVRTYTVLLENASQASVAVDRGQEITLRRRLAQNLLRLGRDREALAQYEWLFRQVPDHLPLEKAGDILQGLGHCYETVGRYDQALDQWRTLAQGLKENTDDWFEAQYRMIRCHQRAGRLEHAQKLLTLLRLRYPRIESANWRKQLDALDRELTLAQRPTSGPVKDTSP